jgi:hypothetical protein
MAMDGARSRYHCILWVLRTYVITPRTYATRYQIPNTKWALQTPYKNWYYVVGGVLGCGVADGGTK